MDEDYEEPTPRKPEKKISARSYIEEQVQPFLPKFRWENETLEKDMKAFWIAIHRLWKMKPTYFKETLVWASENQLHPMAFVKAVHSITKKK